MKIDFVRYLDAKYDLDLRSMNHATLECLFAYLGKLDYPVHILEIGGGIGAMPTYLLDAPIKTKPEYTLIDSAADNIAFIPGNLAKRAADKGFRFEEIGSQQYQISGDGSTWQLNTICSSTEDFLRARTGNPEYDVVVASSYLDIVPVPETLRLLDKVVTNPTCLYLPFNYDGLTYFHPAIDKVLDEEIIRLYNLSMDNRLLGGIQTGGSLTGRKLLDWLPQAGYEVSSAGSSDWILIPHSGSYAADESYFLECIIQFVEDSVSPLWESKPEILLNWLAARRRQISEGKLTYLANQIDLMALRGGEG